MLLLVEAGQLHRLRHHLDIVGCVVAERGQVEAFQDAQHLPDRHATGRRFRQRHGEAAIGHPQRRTDRGAEAGQVGQGQQPALGFHVGDDPAAPARRYRNPRRRPAPARAGGGQRRVAHRLAQPFRRAVRPQVERPAFLGIAELLDIAEPSIGPLIHGEHGMDVRANDPAFLGEADGRAEQGVPWLATELRMRIGEDPQRPRHRHRQRAAFIDIALHPVAEAITHSPSKASAHISSRTAPGQVPRPFSTRCVPVAGSRTCRVAMPPMPHIIGSTTPWVARRPRSHRGHAAGGQHGGASLHRLRLRGDDHGARLGQAAGGAGHRRVSSLQASFAPARCMAQYRGSAPCACCWRPCRTRPTPSRRCRRRWSASAATARRCSARRRSTSIAAPAPAWAAT